MARVQSQFSLVSLFALIGVSALALSVNVKSHVTSHGLLAFGQGELEWVELSRGWPFRYLQFQQSVVPGTGQQVIAQGWPWNQRSVPRVTHRSLLLADISLAVLVASFMVLGIPRLLRWFGTLHMDGVGGDRQFG